MHRSSDWCESISAFQPFSISVFFRACKESQKWLILAKKREAPPFCAVDLHPVRAGSFCFWRTREVGRGAVKTTGLALRI
jgi:hypothetical protein